MQTAQPDNDDFKSLAQAYVSAALARDRLVADPFRTLGMPALILAKLENWQLKTDQFALVSGASRPTARKLLKIYAENGLGECLDESWFATDLMSDSLNDACNALQEGLAKSQLENIQATKLGLIRAEYGATQRLCPVQGRPLFSLIRLYVNHTDGDKRRIRNVLQDHSSAIGQDLESELRRWILNGWVETSDEHFFNDRWLQLTPLGLQIAKQFLTILNDCLAKAHSQH